MIGIFQKRDRTNGIVFERRGLTSRQFASFNSADDIARFFNSKSNQVIKFEIFGGEVNFEAINKKFVVIQILESRSFIPVVYIKDFKPRERHCRLVKDTIYIRPISDPIESRAISSKEEWEEMILRLLVHKEEILHKDLISICRSITKKGKVVKLTKKISSQAQNKYDKVLKRDKLK